MWQERLALLAEGHCPVGHGRLVADVVLPQVGVRAGRTIPVGRCDSCVHGWRLYTNEEAVVVEYLDLNSGGCAAGRARFMLSEPFPWERL